MSYHEIENLNEISRLGKKLQDSLYSATVHTRKRTIGFPGNKEVRDVSFLTDNGADSLWFANWESIRTPGKIVNLFGRGDPHEDTQLTIDVQFNYNTEKFTRQLGGVFLKDIDSGEIIVAHRGIITKKSRIELDIVFEVMAADVIEGENSDGCRDYLFITLLNSKKIISEIAEFSQNLRKSFQDLDLTSMSGANTNKNLINPSSRSRNLNGLRPYFKEFSGKRRAFTPRKVFPDCTHGKVVNALEQEFFLSAETLKSTAVDLVVNGKTSSILFEVKTNSGTQNIYTAVGQLTVHMPKVAEFTKKIVSKVLVIPEKPLKELEKILETELNILIVTYEISAKGKVTFSGLEKI